eukprot:2649679-Karenia_brevis.AAC.1
MRSNDGPLAKDMLAPIGSSDVPDRPSGHLLGILVGLCLVCQETSYVTFLPSTPYIVPCGSVEGNFDPPLVGHQPSAFGVADPLMGVSRPYEHPPRDRLCLPQSMGT